MEFSNPVVALASQQIGKPYLWAQPVNKRNPTPNGFDCSGLPMWCYWHVLHYTLTHYTGTQYHQLKHRLLGEAQPGDLIFYRAGANIYHVAICAGNSTLIEAPQPGTPVRSRAYSSNDYQICKRVGIMPGSPTGGSVDTVAGEVFAQTNNPRVQLAMLFDPPLEGGGRDPLGVGPWGVGDQGTSYGPYQIHLPAHPGVTAAEADNPHDAVRFMLPSYEAAVNDVPESLWQSDPERAVEETAYRAEGPTVDYYTSHGTAAVDSAYRNAVKVQQNPSTFVSGPVPPYPVKAFNNEQYYTIRIAGIPHKVVTQSLQITPPILNKSHVSATIMSWMSAKGYHTADQNNFPALVWDYCVAAATNEQTPYNPGGAGSLISGLTSALDGFKKAFEWLTTASNWKRIGLFVLGAIILLLTAIEVFKQ